MAQKRLADPEQQEHLKKIDDFKKANRGKRAEEITDAEVIAWAKAKMLDELKL